MPNAYNSTDKIPYSKKSILLSSVKKELLDSTRNASINGLADFINNNLIFSLKNKKQIGIHIQELGYFHFHSNQTSTEFTCYDSYAPSACASSMLSRDSFENSTEYDTKLKSFSCTMLSLKIVEDFLDTCIFRVTTFNQIYTMFKDIAPNYMENIPKEWRIVHDEIAEFISNNTVAMGHVKIIKMQNLLLSNNKNALHTVQ